MDLQIGTTTIPARDIHVRFSRSGGPGGQNVNRRDTRVEVLVDLDALTAAQRRRVRERLRGRLDRDGRIRVVSSAGRTQRENRARALARLATLLAEALAPPPPPRRATRPTAGAKERRLEGKRKRGEVKRLRRSADKED